MEEETGATGSGAAAEQVGTISARARRRTHSDALEFALLAVMASDDVKQLLLDWWPD
jgi:hypothetical protein